jgi:DNA repair protein RecN (Recombination protein N)
MVDLWSYQRKEIEQAQLIAGEDESWKREARAGQCGEALCRRAWERLSSFTRAAILRSALRARLRNVEELARYDSKFVEATQQLVSARAIVGDL